MSMQYSNKLKKSTINNGNNYGYGEQLNTQTVIKIREMQKTHAQDISVLNIEKQNLDDENQALKLEMQNQKEKYDKLSKSYEDAISWEIKFNEEVERAKRVEKTNAKKIMKYEDDITVLNSTIEKLHSGIQTLDQNIVELNDENSAIKEDLSIMESNFDTLKNENNALRGEIDHLHTTLQDYEQQIFEASTENLALNNTQIAENELLKEAYTTIEFMQKKFAELQKDYNDIMKSLNNSKQANLNLKLENVKLSEQQLQKDKQFGDLLKSLNEYEIKINKLNSDIEESSVRISNLDKEKKVLREVCETSKLNVNQFKAESNKLFELYQSEIYSHINEFSEKLDAMYIKQQKLAIQLSNINCEVHDKEAEIEKSKLLLQQKESILVENRAFLELQNEHITNYKTAYTPRRKDALKEEVIAAQAVKDHYANSSISRSTQTSYKCINESTQTSNIGYINNAGTQTANIIYNNPNETTQTTNTIRKLEVSWADTLPQSVPQTRRSSMVNHSTQAVQNMAGNEEGNVVLNTVESIQAVLEHNQNIENAKKISELETTVTELNSTIVELESKTVHLESEIIHLEAENSANIKLLQEANSNVGEEKRLRKLAESSLEFKKDNLEDIEDIFEEERKRNINFREDALSKFNVLTKHITVRDQGLEQYKTQFEQSKKQFEALKSQSNQYKSQLEQAKLIIDKLKAQISVENQKAETYNLKYISEAKKVDDIKKQSEITLTELVKENKIVHSSSKEASKDLHIDDLNTITPQPKPSPAASARFVLPNQSQFLMPNQLFNSVETETYHSSSSEYINNQIIPTIEINKISSSRKKEKSIEKENYNAKYIKKIDSEVLILKKHRRALLKELDNIELRRSFHAINDELSEIENQVDVEKQKEILKKLDQLIFKSERSVSRRKSLIQARD